MPMGVSLKKTPICGDRESDSSKSENGIASTASIPMWGFAFCLSKGFDKSSTLYLMQFDNDLFFLGD